MIEGEIVIAIRELANRGAGQQDEIIQMSPNLSGRRCSRAVQRLRAARGGVNFG